MGERSTISAKTLTDEIAVYLHSPTGGHQLLNMFTLILLSATGSCSVYNKLQTLDCEFKSPVTVAEPIFVAGVSHFQLRTD